MDDQMPKAVEDGAERAEEAVEQAGARTEDPDRRGVRRGTIDAARDLGEGDDWEQPEEPRTTVD